MRCVKIPRPKEPETEFKRKRAPPPQATKLLIASLSAGLIFMALLAIVFVPRYLEGLNQPPSTILTLAVDTNGTVPRIVVTASTLDLPLAEFNATLYRDNATVATLSAGLAGGTSELRFVDANADGRLDAGDYFEVQASQQGTYRFEVWQVNFGRVGVQLWTGALA